MPFFFHKIPVKLCVDKSADAGNWLNPFNRSDRSGTQVGSQRIKQPKTCSKSRNEIPGKSQATTESINSRQKMWFREQKQGQTEKL